MTSRLNPSHVVDLLWALSALVLERTWERESVTSDDIGSTVAAQLRASRYDVFEAGVEAATRLGEDGDRLLAATLVDLPRWRQVMVVAAMGNLTGSRGSAVLGQALTVTGPGSRDLRCAALWALAKREGEAATGDLVRTLTESRDGVVRAYAVTALAGVGDDRGWEPVLSWLRKFLARPSRGPTFPPLVPVAVAYLMRPSSADPARTARVVRLLREKWDALDVDEREWLSQLWPQAHPDGPRVEEVEPPDPVVLEGWIASNVAVHAAEVD